MTCERPRCNATPSEDFLHTSHCTLHTPHFTLHTCTSHSTLHLISNHVSSSHLISALLISSHLFSHVIQVSSSLSTHLSCSAHQKSLAVREKSFAQKIDWAQKLLRTEAWDTDAFTLYTDKPLQNTLYYKKACTKHFPVQLCTTKLAQSTSQYSFVLQSLHKLLPSTTVYYKACKKHFAVLLCTTKLAHSSTALPSTTLYYKACTKHVPVLLCTTKLAQSTSQYYFVLQSSHKALPSTTLYYKARTKHFPVLLCTAKLAQTTPWQNNMDKKNKKDFFLSMLIEGWNWCGRVQVNLKNHDFGNFRA